MTIRLRVKEIAEAQGYNQSRLQLKAQVSAQLMNRYWNNNVESVSLKHLALIARALGVKSSDLLVDEDETSEPAA